MKYCFVLIVLLFSIHPAFSQGQLIVESSVSKSKDSLILYVGIPNRIVLKIREGSQKVTTAKILPGQGYKIQGADLQTIYVELSQKDSVILNVSVGEEVKTLKAELRFINDVYVGLNRARNTVFYKSELLKFKGLIVFFEDQNFSRRLIVTSYVVTGNDGNGWQSIKNRGPYFSEEVLKLLKNVKRGTKVLFEEIRAYGPDSRSRMLNSFYIRVL